MEITLGTALAVLGFLGGLISIYVYIRVELAKLNIRICELERRLSKSDDTLDLIFNKIDELKDLIINKLK